MKKLLISLVCIMAVVSLTACSSTTEEEPTVEVIEEVQTMTKSVKVPVELKVEGTTLADKGIEAVVDTSSITVILEGPIEIVSRLTDENLELYVTLNNDAAIDDVETLEVVVTGVDDVVITLKTTEVTVTYSAAEVTE
jgi:hypothetical protein